MKKLLMILATAVSMYNAADAQSEYKADTEKSTISWLGEKVTGQHTGTVELQSGSITWQDNKITGGEFLIDMKTIEESEDQKKFEAHMASEDFFNVEKYPISKLVITESTPFDKGTGAVKGTLTIKDITKPVEFKAAKQEKDDGLWFYTNITVDRTDYDIRYGSGSFFENLGDKTIYDEFRLKVSLLMKKQ